MSRLTRILRLDASANPESPVSRALGDCLVERLRQRGERFELRQRDLNDTPNFIDAKWIAANLTAAESRDDAARQRLALSDELIAELQWADHVLLTTPMYNFGVPAPLKSWIDQVCRAGITFRYTPDGPVGLLEGKRADIVISTGGVPLGSPVDFVSGYLRQVFGFIGIDAVEIYGADRTNIDHDASVAQALDQIDARYPKTAA